MKRSIQLAFAALLPVSCSANMLNIEPGTSQEPTAPEVAESSEKWVPHNSVENPFPVETTQTNSDTGVSVKFKLLETRPYHLLCDIVMSVRLVEDLNDPLSTFQEEFKHMPGVLIRMNRDFEISMSSKKEDHPNFDFAPNGARLAASCYKFLGEGVPSQAQDYPSQSPTELCDPEKLDSFFCGNTCLANPETKQCADPEKLWPHPELDY